MRHEPDPVFRRSQPCNLKHLAKSAARIVARSFVLPAYLSYRLRALFIGESAFATSSQMFSLLPGLFGDYLRREFYRLSLRYCSPHVSIGFGTLFSSCTATVGDNVYIGSYCMIGDADIEQDVLLGSNVHLLSGKAQHGIDDLDLPIRLQPRRFERLRIGKDTWIGNSTIVMANVGTKCVVGAGSVVVSDIPDFCIAAGNPARVLKQRQAVSPGPQGT